LTLNRGIDCFPGWFSGLLPNLDRCLIPGPLLNTSAVDSNAPDQSHAERERFLYGTVVSRLHIRGSKLKLVLVSVLRVHISAENPGA
jgi:hypothetical protein